MKSVHFALSVFLALAAPAVSGAAAPGQSAGVPAPGSPPPASRKPTPPPETGMKLTPMNRATFFVRNQAESLKLYRDLLGLRVYFSNYWDNDGINAVMGTKGETLNAVVLEGSSENVFGKIGIYQLSAASVAKAPPPSRSTTTDVGDAAVVFTTNDVDTLFAKIKAAGYVIISAPASLSVNPNMKVQGKEMQFRDPDGIIVNLVQPGVPK